MLCFVWTGTVDQQHIIYIAMSIADDIFCVLYVMYEDLILRIYSCYFLCAIISLKVANTRQTCRRDYMNKTCNTLHIYVHFLYM